jgi:hypothetical protein
MRQRMMSPSKLLRPADSLALSLVSERLQVRACVYCVRVCVHACARVCVRAYVSVCV